jgi:hypothetical protein
MQTHPVKVSNPGKDKDTDAEKFSSTGKTEYREKSSHGNDSRILQKYST